MADSELTSRVVYHSTYWLSYHALTFGLSFRATGRENIPVTGPALLVSNHQSYIDPWLIGQAATRRLRYLARHNLFHNAMFARLIRCYGAVPIDRGFGKEGLQTVFKELADGQAVVIFAEGERTHTGEVQPLKPGISLLMKRVMIIQSLRPQAANKSSFGSAGHPGLNSPKNALRAQRSEIRPHSIVRQRDLKSSHESDSHTQLHPKQSGRTMV